MSNVIELRTPDGFLRRIIWNLLRRQEWRVTLYQHELWVTHNEQNHAMPYSTLQGIEFNGKQCILSFQDSSLSLPVYGSTPLGEHLVKSVLAAHYHDKQRQADQKLNTLLARVELPQNTPFVANRYISHTEFSVWADTIPEIYDRKQLETLVETATDKHNISKAKQWLEFTSIIDNSHQLRETHNRNFIERNIPSTEKKAFAKHLTREQKEAALTSEDNTLLIASAGSGKTATIIAKANYAMTLENIKPEEILILGFNRDTSDELADRMNTTTGEFGKAVNVATFHQLGLHIIGQATGHTPTVAEWTINLTDQSHSETEWSKMISSLIAADPSFADLYYQLCVCYPYDVKPEHPV